MMPVSSGVPATDAVITQLRRLTCPPEAGRILDALLRGQSRPWLAHDEGSLDVRAVTAPRGRTPACRVPAARSADQGASLDVGAGRDWPGRPV